MVGASLGVPGPGGLVPRQRLGFQIRYIGTVYSRATGGRGKAARARIGLSLTSTRLREALFDPGNVAVAYATQWPLRAFSLPPDTLRNLYTQEVAAVSLALLVSGCPLVGCQG